MHVLVGSHPPRDSDCNIDHTDLSVGDLGVVWLTLNLHLRDFDLDGVPGAGEPGDPRSTGRTGTVACMALDSSLTS